MDNSMNPTIHPVSGFRGQWKLFVKQENQTDISYNEVPQWRTLLRFRLGRQVLHTDAHWLDFAPTADRKTGVDLAERGGVFRSTVVSWLVSVSRCALRRLWPDATIFKGKGQLRMQPRLPRPARAVLDTFARCDFADWVCLQQHWSEQSTTDRGLVVRWLVAVGVLLASVLVVLYNSRRRRRRLPLVVLLSCPSAETVASGAGKTTLFWRLWKGQLPRYAPVPSQQPNEAVVTLDDGVRFLLVDLPSDARARGTWGRFTSLDKLNAAAVVVVYVVDAKTDSLTREAEYLFRDIDVRALLQRGTTCVVLANKADLRTAMPAKVFLARWMREVERLGHSRTNSLTPVLVDESTIAQIPSLRREQRLMLVHGSAKTGDCLPKLYTVIRSAVRHR